MADCSFPGLLVSSGDATLDDPSLCYQDPGRLTGKLENTHCSRGPVVGSRELLCSIVGNFPEYLFRPFAGPLGLVTNLSFVRVADDSPAGRTQGHLSVRI